jgi:hypothetical protein
MKTDQSARRIPAKKAARKAAKPAKPAKGFMGRKETLPLIMAAREAYAFQLDLDNLDKGTSFDDFRRPIIAELADGATGFSDCKSVYFRPLMARFKLLAGKDEKALELELRSGKVTSSGAPDDTREAREGVAHEIARRLAEHIRLHDAPWAQLDAEFAEQGKDGKWIVKAMERKIALEAAGGPIREGYLVAIVRQKTRRPDLKLTGDLAAALAERCTVKQLRDLLSTLVNRINAKEGVGTTAKRNRKQAAPQARQERSTKTLAPRFNLPPHPPCA